MMVHPVSNSRKGFTVLQKNANVNLKKNFQ